jgi:hypothetical protein
LLLVLIASTQLALSEADELDRWKGGGFAMFATNEHRLFQIHLSDGDRCVSDHVMWPAPLAIEQTRLTKYPTESRLASFAEDLLTEWRFHYDDATGTNLRVVSNERASAWNTYQAFPARFDGLRLEVWRFVFRVRGEDRNGNGALDPGEDLVANGVLDAPLVIPELILSWTGAPD